MKSDTTIPLFVASLGLGMLLGWTIGQGSEWLFLLVTNHDVPVWMTAIGTISAVIVALAFGVVTHRREVTLKQKEETGRIDRASALAVVFDHELHMAQSLALAIGENINDDYLAADIEELVSLTNVGLQKIDLPLLTSFSRSLSDFSPQMAASLLVVLSRYMQMQNNGPVPFGEDIPRRTTTQSLRAMKRLLNRWVQDIVAAKEGLSRYSSRIAEIEVRPVDLTSIIRGQN